MVGGALVTCHGPCRGVMYFEGGVHRLQKNNIDNNKNNNNSSNNNSSNNSNRCWILECPTIPELGCVFRLWIAVPKAGSAIKAIDAAMWRP